MFLLSHCAITIPRGTLTSEYRADLVEFYGEVFGFGVSPVEAQPSTQRAGRNMVTLVLDEGYEHFLVLLESDMPIDVRDVEHFGIEVTSSDELDRLYGRCVEFQRRDPRLWLSSLPARTPQPQPEYDNWTQRGIDRRAFNLRYRLPFALEISHNDYLEGRVPAQRWRYG
jgi:hypothetical protein